MNTSLLLAPEICCAQLHGSSVSIIATPTPGPWSDVEKLQDTECKRGNGKHYSTISGAGSLEGGRGQLYFQELYIIYTGRDYIIYDEACCVAAPVV